MTKKKGVAKKRAQVVKGGGNVFADLALLDADEALTKAELARQIVEIIEAKALTQARAAAALGIDQPKVSALVRGRLEGFSTERLVRFLNVLGRDVDIVVRRARGAAGAVGAKVGRTRVLAR